MEKPSLPKGTRDFGPVVMAKRQFILDSIKKVFQKYGFQPLETPAMENLSTLTGKYGDEGDQLLFRILDSGEFYEKFKTEYFSQTSAKIVNTRDFIFNNLLTFTLNFIKSSAIDPLIKDKPETVNKHLRDYFDSSYFKSLVEIERPQEKIIIEAFLFENFIPLVNSLSLYYLNSNMPSYRKDSNELDIEYLFKLRSDDFNNWILPVLENISFRLVKTDQVRLKTTEKGLRYDLTVPFARYVVMNRGEITFPFKRYQIQPVWRADRPQKGRYREFYQCDADVVGTDSLICEAEIILMIKEVFKSLKISDYSIKINHRGILSGLAEVAGAKENETALFVAIDKLDKVGEEKVKEELRTKGFDDKSLNAVFEVLNKQGSTATKIDLLTQNFSASDKGKKGIADLSAVLQLLKDYGVSEDHVEFDISLARGLSYYTGCIFEVKINNVAIGSVSGGGRYDNLTQAFGAKERLSGVGISFGVDRLFDAMEELKLFPEEAQISSTVLITHFDSESQRYGLRVLQTLRSNNVAAEIYPDTIKIQKQLDYANKKMIPYVIVIGSEEVKSGLLSFKNMKTGEQTKIGIEDILNTLKSADGRKQ
jgi:histidyl-tRNA synthetase